MIYNWLHHSIECDTLIVFFNGWGMTSHVVSHLDNGGMDVLVLSGYDNESIDTQIFKRYENVYLVAWSMGVWYAAAFPFEGLSNIKKKIAFCGTMRAVDDEYGIPKNVFEATVAGLSQRSREKFAMRIFGGKKAYDAMGQDVLVPFNQAEKELSFWNENKNVQIEEIWWDVAVIGTLDMIYPVENQENYWKKRGVRTIEKGCAHFPFGEFKTWKEIINL